MDSVQPQMQEGEQVEGEGTKKGAQNFWQRRTKTGRGVGSLEGEGERLRREQEALEARSAWGTARGTSVFCFSGAAASDGMAQSMVRCARFHVILRCAILVILHPALDSSPD